MRPKINLVGPFHFGPQQAAKEKAGQGWDLALAFQSAKLRLPELGEILQSGRIRGYGIKRLKRLKFLGIDGGSSGAYAVSDDLLSWDVGLVETVREWGHRLLHVEKNEEILHLISQDVGGLNGVVAAYEEGRKNRKFGFKNNFVNGRNSEFWRVTLALKRIRHCGVDPKTWQAVAFKGIPAGRTKDRAREYIRRRCPGTEWLDSFNKAPREAIVDAMCIAIWCRDQYFANEENQADSEPEGGSDCGVSLESSAFEI